MLLRRLIVSVVTFAVLLSTSHALAGGGPANVLLVVNRGDAGSKTVANYFVDARRLSPNNILYLDWKYGDRSITVDQFRDDLLAPINDFIASGKLEDQIDYIVYSSGFPWGVDFTADIPAQLKNLPVFQAVFKFPTASLTGLTYLQSQVLTKSATNYVAFNANRYLRLRESKDGGTYELPALPNGQLNQIAGHQLLVARNIDPTSVGSHGFRHRYGWGLKGEMLPAGGSRYRLSVVLGVTNGRGNTVSEIRDYLRNSPAADGRFPRGTICFMKNGDVRTRTRLPGYAMAIEKLEELGVKAEVLDGDLPRRKPDVQGLLTGVADFSWPRSGSVIQRGAICENLTSFSGLFDVGAPQTPCTEFLKFGAAGTSGPVNEPFSIQNKFPHAMIQVHYARGCTLAEAFYQSIYSPYQLLVIGDPLCRPWANIPRIRVEGVSAEAPLKGLVSLRPTAELPRGGECASFELFVDGRRLATCNAGGTLAIDTAKYSDGYHEIRVVGIEQSAIETQGEVIVDVQFDNFGRSVEFTAKPLQVNGGRPINVSAKCAQATGVAIYHNGQVVATIAGESGEAQIDSRSLGDGPVTLTAIAWRDGKEYAMATPIKLFVQSGAGGK